MNEWIQTRRKVILTEIIAGCIMLGCILLGLWWQFRFDLILGTMSQNIDQDFAKVILQIQATVDTLTISIIALISGSVSDSNMGIVFSDYYLNIRPLVFKQKRIIVSSLILLAINIGFYIVNWYCMVLWVFAVTIVLIMMSINEIYVVFIGKGLAEREIKDYVNYVLSKKCDYRRKYGICTELVDDWKSIIPSQSRDNYEIYKEVFLNGVVELLNYGTQESLTGIKDICYRSRVLLPELRK